MCGIIGVVARTPVNQTLYDGLLLLQHRGQDAAGIVTESFQTFHMHKGPGLVRDVFRTRNMRSLPGEMGIAHCRYPTAGSASNAGEAQPASLTEQIDAGLRYAFRPGLTLVAGVFEVSKPYFDRDAANFFTRVGALRHRGVEMSLSGQPIEGLKVVVGTQLLQARVSGFTVDQGLIGPVPPGRTPVLVRLNGNYGPAGWRGFSLNGQVNFEDSQYANRINNFRIPSATVLDLGARYDFKAMSASASLRFDVRNVTNLYGWTVNGSAGNFMALPPRRYSVRMAADF